MSHVSILHCLETRIAGYARGFLLLEAELLDDGRVAALVVLLEVAKMAPAISDHLKETAT